MDWSPPALGHGIGLRAQHYAEMIAAPPPVDWLEVISENFFVKGGRPLAVLNKIRQDVPIALHGVSLSIGASDPLSKVYLQSLKTLMERVEPAIVSDHLCWGSHQGKYGHDLWPLPYTEESLTHVSDRVAQVQEVLGRPILLENVSTYIEFAASSMPEWEFIAEVSRRSGCGILLDINNIYVSAFNHGYDALTYLDGIPPDKVGQFHLAGHTHRGTHLIDTHVGPTPDTVWELYRHALARFGPVSTLIEWDEDVPELSELVAESKKAEQIESQLSGPRTA